MLTNYLKHYSNGTSRFCHINSVDGSHWSRRSNRHKKVEKKVHWGLCKKEVLDSRENGMNMPPEGPVENDETKLLLGCNVFNVTN